MIIDSAKTILCYGDSNTWGANPETDVRFPRSVRWTSILQNILGNDYEVISEGLPGRTLVAQDPSKPFTCGITHLESILQSAEPIDTVIVMLGTNDVKTKYGLSPKQVAEHLNQTIEAIKNSDIGILPKILVICPPPVIVPESGELDERMVPGLEAFKVLPALYAEVASSNGCEFINAGDHIQSSKKDGYHWDSETHRVFAHMIKDWIINHV